MEHKTSFLAKSIGNIIFFLIFPLFCVFFIFCFPSKSSKTLKQLGLFLSLILFFSTFILLFFWETNTPITNHFFLSYTIQPFIVWNFPATLLLSEFIASGDWILQLCQFDFSITPLSYGLIFLTHLILPLCLLSLWRNTIFWTIKASWISFFLRLMFNWCFHNT